ncbi:hypothetical protein TEA_025388 [Camellia sinensis var. sinensis]|uniref:RING-type domain-containing protein n=1 Tax=Camellia sinensis var. sinensis TaxID=542762 RepID=A0A4V3WRD0_CAMSN|nr:hypothetical protein TEA_025388 [Camellia sinensis var. sinensis]
MGSELEHKSLCHGSDSLVKEESLNMIEIGVLITGGDAKSEPPVVMRSLIADIAIMKPRTQWTLILSIGMIFHAMKLKRSYVPYVAQNKITGGKDNFFHCNKCGCCYSKLIKDAHHCVEQAMHHNCPICFEFLFDTMKDITVLPCGHTIHLECLKEMELHFRYSCPVCSKSICDLSNLWEKLDQEVASTPMPNMYQNKMVWILCNDCGERSKVHFHIVAHKCLRCKSYNTRQIQGGGGYAASCPSRIAEMAR